MVVVRPVFWRWFLLFLALWTLLSGARGWGFGIPVALAAAWLVSRLALRWPGLSIRYLPGFMAFFARELVLGGWDVAYRAVHPRLPIDPAWVSYPLRNNSKRVTLVLSALVGLLPGTLASHFDDDTLYIHALDQRQDWRSTVMRLERQLVRLLEGAEP